MPNKPKIVVLGSLAMDLIFEVPKWPVILEAVQAKSFDMQPGGKGLNQAVAAARLGAQVSIISAVGQDLFGDLVLAMLEKEGVGVEHVNRSPNKGTDSPCVIIKNKEPGFIGTKLASQTINSDLVLQAKTLIQNADFTLASGEVPKEVVRTAFEIAKQSGRKTILNPAPPEKQNRNLLLLTDYLVPNKWEAPIAAGVDEQDRLPNDEVAAKLHDMGAKNVIITTGAVGFYALLDEESMRFHAYKVKSVDSTGASDAYCAALAVALSRGIKIKDALKVATAAGALACTMYGGSTSMPSKDRLNDFLRRSNTEIDLD